MSKTKKATTKKATKKKVASADAGWDKVESVKATTAPAGDERPPVDNAVPFGSPTELTQAIKKIRDEWNKGTVKRNGVSVATNGDEYTYYLTEDVMDFVSAQLGADGVIDSSMEVIDGMNVMTLTLDYYRSGEKKIVSANLGSPTSMADFGSRITYVPKYLLAIMFGISIQTDKDAFGVGVHKDKYNERRNSQPTSKDSSGNPPSKNSDTVVANVTSSGSSSSASVGPVETSSTSGPKGDVEHSSSYPKAKAFVEKASSKTLLDQAEIKVNNATGLYENEKAELREFIQKRRTEIES